ncbi:MAG: hypothetical protein GX592_09990 [Clostridiales bacterium]|nr:hypothetical protein [Clostridiales bacterium]
MDNLGIYKIWAPDDAAWTEWAKPVLFANRPRYEVQTLVLPEVDWPPRADSGAALIVDAPGEKGVLEGLALAKLGYRPVPVYNGVYAPDHKAMLVNVAGVAAALFRGADLLPELPPDAPPAFLLDANRMKGMGKEPGKYDNRWCVFPQDMPSAAALIQRGVRRVAVRADAVQNDLAHILRRYQEAGIPLSLSDGRGERKLSAARPSGFKSLFYRLRALAGLSRNAAGGFGAWIPEAMQGGDSTMRYYGIG